MILRTVSLLPEKTLLMIKNAIGKAYKELTKNEIVTLVAAQEEYQITNTRLQVLLGINTIEASKILTFLIEKNLITAEGQGRGTRYLLSDTFGKSRGDISNSINKSDELHKQGETLYTMDENSINKGLELHKQEDENSINKGGNSINNEAEIHKQLVTSSINKDGSGSIDLSNLTLEIQKNRGNSM